MWATPNTSSPSLTCGPSWTVVSCATRAFLGGYPDVSKPIHRIADYFCHSQAWQSANPFRLMWTYHFLSFRDNGNLNLSLGGGHSTRKLELHSESVNAVSKHAHTIGPNASDSGCKVLAIIMGHDHISFASYFVVGPQNAIVVTGLQASSFVSVLCNRMPQE